MTHIKKPPSPQPSPASGRGGIFLMGPTAIGKTDLAIQLAEYFPIEIVSVDSVMVYQGMDIGTHKPSQTIRQKIPHHLIDIRRPNEFYSAGDFVRDATLAIQSIRERQHIPLLVGGTMLYFHALQFGLSQLPVRDESVRKSIQQMAEEKGWETVHQTLRGVDPEAAKKISPHDKQRLQRALEVYTLTQKPFSKQQKENAGASHLECEPLVLCLCPADRKSLNQKIESRFHEMLKQGFLEEVRHLYENHLITQDSPAARAVGYRQALQYFSGTINYEKMVQTAILATQHLAKRQLTWLNHWPSQPHKLLVEKEQTCFSELRQLMYTHSN